MFSSIWGLGEGCEEVYCSGNASLVNTIILRLEIVGWDARWLHQMFVTHSSP
jgi:hypothetical protein